MSKCFVLLLIILFSLLGCSKDCNCPEKGVSLAGESPEKLYRRTLDHIGSYREKIYLSGANVLLKAQFADLLLLTGQDELGSDVLREILNMDEVELSGIKSDTVAVSNALGSLMGAYTMKGDGQYLKAAQKIARVCLSDKSGLISGDKLITGDLEDLFVAGAAIVESTGDTEPGRKMKKLAASIVSLSAESGGTGKYFDSEAGKWKIGEGGFWGASLYKCYLISGDRFYNDLWEQLYQIWSKRDGVDFCAEFDLDNDKRFEPVVLKACKAGIVAELNSFGNKKSADLVMSLYMKIWKDHGFLPDDIDLRAQVIDGAFSMKPGFAESLWSMYEQKRSRVYQRRAEELLHRIVSYCHKDGLYYSAEFSKEYGVPEKIRTSDVLGNFRFLLYIFSPEGVIDFNNTVLTSKGHILKRSVSE